MSEWDWDNQAAISKLTLTTSSVRLDNWEAYWANLGKLIQVRLYSMHTHIYTDTHRGVLVQDKK